MNVFDCKIKMRIMKRILITSFIKSVHDFTNGFKFFTPRLLFQQKKVKLIKLPLRPISQTVLQTLYR